MSIGHIRQSVIPGSPGRKRDVRTQFGALCFRRKGGDVEVLLVTSRTTRRWVVPKGWPVPGVTPVEAAATEAWEEAGVRGRVSSACIGIYSYTKVIEAELAEDADMLPCVVALFPLKVTELSRTFPERRERRRKWFSLKKAAAKVDEPELAQLLLGFRPEMYF